MRAVRVLPPAADEIRGAVRYYEEQDAHDAAQRLVAEVDGAVARLSRMAHSYAPMADVDSERPVRRVRLRKFPYMLVYFIDDDDVVQVVAFAHLSRRHYWLKRV